MLETAYVNSTLPHSPDEAHLKRLLMQCLEAHYGTLSQAVAVQPEMSALLGDLQWLLEKYQNKAPDPNCQPGLGC
jgi:hypothetical protein